MYFPIASRSHTQKQMTQNAITTTTKYVSLFDYEEHKSVMAKRTLDF